MIVTAVTSSATDRLLAATRANSHRRQQVLQIRDENAARLPADLLAANQGDAGCVQEIRGKRNLLPAGPSNRA